MVEHRSPKPRVAGSSPVSPATDVVGVNCLRKSYSRTVFFIAMNLPFAREYSIQTIP